MRGIKGASIGASKSAGVKGAARPARPARRATVVAPQGPALPRLGDGEGEAKREGLRPTRPRRSGPLGLASRCGGRAPETVAGTFRGAQAKGRAKGIAPRGAGPPAPIGPKATTNRCEAIRGPAPPGRAKVGATVGPLGSTHSGRASSEEGPDTLGGRGGGGATSRA